MITMKTDLDGDGIVDYAWCSKDPAYLHEERCCYPGGGQPAEVAQIRARCENIRARLGTRLSYNGCDSVETMYHGSKMHIPPGLLLSAPQVSRPRCAVLPAMCCEYELVYICRFLQRLATVCVRHFPFQFCLAHACSSCSLCAALVYDRCACLQVHVTSLGKCDCSRPLTLRHWTMPSV